MGQGDHPDTESSDTPNARLLRAAEQGDVDLIERLIANDPPEADPDCARASDGATPLMIAAEQGHAAAVAALLRGGAQWNALDAGGHCTGEYSGGRHPDVTQILMQWAVEMEELLEEREAAAQEAAGEGAGAAGGSNGGGGGGGGGGGAATTREEEEEEESRAYLSQRLVYDDADPTGPRLLDANGDAVMMGWEQPIMRRHADALCGCQRSSSSAGDGPAAASAPSHRPPLAVLNVGYGLGIVDREMQRHGPTRHVIVEAHPDVLARLDAEGWPARPGVTVLRGRWEEALAPGAPAFSAEGGALADVMASGGFDAIYWDTYAQHARQLAKFHSWLPRLLKRPPPQPSPSGAGAAAAASAARGGRYSWFNGVGSDNAFFHAVSTQVIARGLARLGFRTAFERFEVGALGDEVWRGVAREYWALPFYLMPLARWEDDGDDGAAAAAAAAGDDGLKEAAAKQGGEERG